MNKIKPGNFLKINLHDSVSNSDICGRPITSSGIRYTGILDYFGFLLSLVFLINPSLTNAEIALNGKYVNQFGSIMELAGSNLYYTGRWSGEEVKRKLFSLNLTSDGKFQIGRQSCSMKLNSIICVRSTDGTIMNYTSVIVEKSSSSKTNGMESGSRNLANPDVAKAQADALRAQAEAGKAKAEADMARAEADAARSRADVEMSKARSAQAEVNKMMAQGSMVGSLIGQSVTPSDPVGWEITTDDKFEASADCQQIITVYGFSSRAQIVCKFKKYSEAVQEKVAKCTRTTAEALIDKLLNDGIRNFDKKASSLGIATACNDVLIAFPKFFVR